MKNIHQFEPSARTMLSKAFRRVLPVICAAAACLGMGRSASAQVAYDADKGGLSLSVGATASGYQVQYGEQKLLGFAGMVDVDTTRHLGIEAEGRWLTYHNPTGIQDKTWLGGIRYHHKIGMFQVYGKGLAGIGQFTFPYDFAHGNYLVFAPGAGADYRVTRRISLRVDAEYQIWPQFTYGSMTSYGLSVGAMYHIF
jgi:hypothetical protein